MTTIPTFVKEIAYDRATGDFRATLDGNYIGHFGSYHAAECALDQVAYDLLMDGQCATAAELDGGASVEAIAADHAVVAPVAQQAVEPGAGGYYFCMVEDCTDSPTHMHGSDPLCCPHYAETTGRACDCADATHADPRPNLIISKGNGWHVAYDRASAMFAAMIDGVGCVGRHAQPRAAQQLCTTHGSTIVAHSTAFVCRVCGALVAYVRLPSGDLAAACQSVRCGATVAITHLEALALNPALSPTCGACGSGAHTIQQCPEVRAALFRPTDPNRPLTGVGPLAARVQITPTDDHCEVMGFLDGVLVGFYPTVATADLALANLAYARAARLIAPVRRCPGAAVFPCTAPAAADGGYCAACARALDRIALAAGTLCTNCGQYGHSAADCPHPPVSVPHPVARVAA